MTLLFKYLTSQVFPTLPSNLYALYNVLMPSQVQDPLPDNASSSNPYGFILDTQHQSEQKPKRMPTNLGKLTLMIGAGGLGLVFLIIIAVAIIGGGGASKDLISALARGQEIARVSALAQPQLRDTDLQGLAATTIISLTSQQAELSAYLKSSGTKIDTKSLAMFYSSKTDSDFKNAASNGNLPRVYTEYLKQNLGAYTTSLRAAYKSGSKNTKAKVAPAILSSQTLLAAPQIASTK